MLVTKFSVCEPCGNFTPGFTIYNSIITEIIDQIAWKAITNGLRDHSNSCLVRRGIFLKLFSDNRWITSRARLMNGRVSYVLPIYNFKFLINARSFSQQMSFYLRSHNCTGTPWVLDDVSVLWYSRVLARFHWGCLMKLTKYICNDWHNETHFNRHGSCDSVENQALFFDCNPVKHSTGAGCSEWFSSRKARVNFLPTPARRCVTHNIAIERVLQRKFNLSLIVVKTAFRACAARFIN